MDNHQKSWVKSKAKKAFQFIFVFRFKDLKMLAILNHQASWEKTKGDREGFGQNTDMSHKKGQGDKWG